MASVQAAGAPASHPYTCNSCQVAYRNLDLQKTHMKSDWHRYNLKRRVASLPPISAEVFTDKVLQARAATTAEADKAYFEKPCAACKKTFYSENAYKNHLSSQKHKLSELAAAQRNDEETKSVVSSTFSLGEPVANKKDIDSDADEEFNQVIEGLQKSKIANAEQPSPIKRPTNPQAENDDSDDEEDEEVDLEKATSSEHKWSVGLCLFCPTDSKTAQLNAEHMRRDHSMFIPELRYLVDLEGLITQLQYKILEGKECLFCDKEKTSVEAVQTHMKDTGHCKIPYTSEEDQLAIGEYYDFRSTYSDDEDSEDESDEGDEPRGGARISKKGGEDEDMEDAEGDGWETDSSASSLDSDDLTAVPAEGHYHQYERLNKHPHHSRDDPRPHHQADGYHSRAHKHTHAVFYDDTELYLPSGARVGHRSYNKYWKQNLTHYPTAEERQERLLLENGERRRSPSREDRPGWRRHRGDNREIVTRGRAGMVGASDYSKQLATIEGARGRKAYTDKRKKTMLQYGMKQNNKEHFRFQYDRGG